MFLQERISDVFRYDKLSYEEKIVNLSYEKLLEMKKI